MDSNFYVKPIGVFICESTTNALCLKRVHNIHVALKDNLHDYNIWYHTYDQESKKGKNIEEWHKEVDQRIRDCRVFLCCLTHGFGKSEAVQELSVAKNIPGKNIIFVKIEEGNFGPFVEHMLTSKNATVYKYSDIDHMLETMKRILDIPKGKNIYMKDDGKIMCNVDKGCELAVHYEDKSIHGCVKNLKKMLGDKMRNEEDLIDEYHLLRNLNEKLNADLKESFEKNDELRLTNENLISEKLISVKNESERGQIHKQLVTLRAEIANLKRIIAQKDASGINRLRREVYTKNLQNRELTHKVKYLKIENDDLEDKNKNLKTENENLRAVNYNLENQISTLKHEK